ncbi:MAG: hypothetical protein MJZ25_14060 [Fibrobacter sp.]|nr:hypothetical protein [Fibrobacter sp.]
MKKWFGLELALLVSLLACSPDSDGKSFVNASGDEPTEEKKRNRSFPVILSASRWGCM